jgi:hypothetical protein
VNRRKPELKPLQTRISETSSKTSPWTEKCSKKQKKCSRKSVQFGAMTDSVLIRTVRTITVGREAHRWHVYQILCRSVTSCVSRVLASLRLQPDDPLFCILVQDALLSQERHDEASLELPLQPLPLFTYCKQPLLTYCQQPLFAYWQ